MADILIKGMEMPDKLHTIDTCRDANGVLQANCGDGTGWHNVVEMPPEENRLYVCDPSKAEGCSKTGCAYTDRAERGDCMLTTRLEWALMEVRSDE